MAKATTPVWDLQLEFRADAQLLQSVRKMVYAYVKGLALPESRCQDIVLAVDEACANSIRHSYVGYSGGVIVLRLGRRPTTLEVTLEDFGRIIPPEKVRPKAKSPVSRDTVQPGGLGVQLIHTVFDEVVYSPGKFGGNHIAMRLNLPPQEESIPHAP